MKRRVGRLSLAVVAFAAVGLLLVMMIGTATGSIDTGSGAAYSLRVGIAGNNVIAPLIEAKADTVNTTASASLANFDNALGGLIGELKLLHNRATVDTSGGTVEAESDTAKVALLRSILPNLQAAAGAVGGLLSGVANQVGGVVDGVTGGSGGVGGVVGGLGGTLGGLTGGKKLGANVPQIGTGNAGLPGVPNALPAIQGAATPVDAISVDAIKGLMTLSCAQLATLRSSSEISRLNAITHATEANGSHILRLDVPLLGIHQGILDQLKDNLGSTTDDHAAALHLSLLEDPLGIGVGLPLHLGDVWLYEVRGTNLTAPDLSHANVSASMDMIHVNLLGGVLPGIESGVDIRVGHAEGALSNCRAVTPPVVPPAVVSGFNVNVTKLVESIGGLGVGSQTGLTAQPGNQAEYSLTVFNNSLSSCAVTKVVDQLPAHFTFVSDAGGMGNGFYDPATNTITWSNLSLANRLAAKQGIVVRIDSDAPAGDYVNVATATGSCGTFIGRSAPISVLGSTTAAPRLDILGKQFRAGSGTTPRTGLPDTMLYVIGGLLAAGALGGTRVLRRS